VLTLKLHEEETVPIKNVSRRIDKIFSDFAKLDLVRPSSRDVKYVRRVANLHGSAVDDAIVIGALLRSNDNLLPTRASGVLDGSENLSTSVPTGATVRSSGSRASAYLSFSSAMNTRDKLVGGKFYVPYEANPYHDPYQAQPQSSAFSKTLPSSWVVPSTKNEVDISGSNSTLETKLKEKFQLQERTIGKVLLKPAGRTEANNLTKVRTTLNKGRRSLIHHAEWLQGTTGNGVRDTVLLSGSPLGTNDGSQSSSLTGSAYGSRTKVRYRVPRGRGLRPLSPLNRERQRQALSYAEQVAAHIGVISSASSNPYSQSQSSLLASSKAAPLVSHVQSVGNLSVCTRVSEGAGERADLSKRVRQERAVEAMTLAMRRQLVTYDSRLVELRALLKCLLDTRHPTPGIGAIIELNRSRLLLLLSVCVTSSPCPRHLTLSPSLPSGLLLEQRR